MTREILSLGIITAYILGITFFLTGSRTFLYLCIVVPMRTVIFLPRWRLWGQKISAKVRDLGHLHIYLYIRFYYQKQQFKKCENNYSFRRSMTVNIIQVCSQLSWAFGNCGISFHSYLNFRIKKSGMSDFPRRFFSVFASFLMSAVLLPKF
jgi:hypothetical protein